MDTSKYDHYASSLIVTPKPEEEEAEEIVREPLINTLAQALVANGYYGEEKKARKDLRKAFELLDKAEAALDAAR